MAAVLGRMKPRKHPRSGMVRLVCCEACRSVVIMHHVMSQHVTRDGRAPCPNSHREYVWDAAEGRWSPVRVAR